VITEETMKHLTRVSPNNRDARLALALRNRRRTGKNHAYIIDPGMALAREICLREDEEFINTPIDLTGLVPYSIEAKLDRTMPAVKQTWAAPTVETRVLDAFDVWAKGVS
jgi:hypothetical protein